MASDSQLRYDGQVVVITGAGSGLGKAYAKFFASRGAKVVVNDLGGGVHGTGSGRSSADIVVKEITDAGGIAVANYDSCVEGQAIIKTAIDNFGRIDVLINNAGILRDITFRNMSQQDWDLIQEVHVTGPYRTSKAAWPYFRKQRYGRVITTSSSSGLFGNFGQSNYAAAKMAMLGLTFTLAKEGAKYGIHANTLAPGAASRLTQTVWPPEMMEAMKPEWVVPLVGVLCHKSCTESGGIFEAGGGHFSKIRWERAKGLLLRPDDSLTADAVMANWDKIIDFKDADHPNRVSNSMELLEKAMDLPPSKAVSNPINFKGRVVLVTGGGAGLGRAYSHHFARLGAKVVVNDMKGAEDVAKEITDAGGQSLAIPVSVEQGADIVRQIIEKYGRIDIIINNAGILRDKAFANMTDDMWNQVMAVHLNGTFAILKAAWPHMLKQKYGRVVNISSTSGIYGNFGQANYASAKTALIGLTKSLAREGAKYNIIVNAVAPSAGTNMTRTVRPESEVLAMKPDYVAPLIAALCSEKPPATGALFESGTGAFMHTRWQRSRGVEFDFAKGPPEVEDVAKALKQICDFDNGQADHPESPAEGSRYTMENVLKSIGAVGPRKREKAKM